jgi:recombination protein RecT
MENTQLAVKPQEQKGLERVKNYILSPEVKERFADMMGSNGIYYLNQVMILVANSADLQQCNPQSILISAMRAASLKLTVDPAQGQAWIIPYKGTATFQLGYRGVYELAMRTGLYRFINVIDIFEGETVSEDRMTGMHTIGGSRSGARVIGRMLYFELLTGYKKTFYMTVEEIEDHARHYSQAYGSSRSKWNDPRERPKMERKTVLVNGLRKWGRFNQGDAAIISEIENAQGWIDRDNGDFPDEEEVTVVVREPKSEKDIMGALGYDQKPAPAPAVVETISEIRRKNWRENDPPMDMAFSMKSSDGNLYCEMPISDLGNRFNSMAKTVKANPDDTATADKMAVVKALIAASTDRLL